MFRKHLIALASAGILSTVPAHAASLPGLTDSYAGTYTAQSTQTGSNLHSFWLPNVLGDPSGRDYWQFDAAGGVFTHDGTNASLTGRIVNNVESNAFFDVDVSFTYTQKGGRTPKCEFGAACGTTAYQDKSDQFEYFDLAAATLTGAGDMAGLVLALTIRPADGSYPPQLGYGADNKDINGFGMSTWFFWNVVQNTNQINIGTDTRGDINIALSAVPLPAALPLLLAALAGLGFVGRRRRTATA